MNHEQKDNKKYDLENRLIQFAIVIMELVEGLPQTRTSNHIAGQLIRCGTSPALNYGEVQSAESQKDFIHKMKIILKELRETNICLKIIKFKPLIKPSQKFDSIIKECNELISIFVSSIRTAQKPKDKDNSSPQRAQRTQRNKGKGGIIA